MITGMYVSNPRSILKALAIAIPAFVGICFWLKNRPVWRFLNWMKGRKSEQVREMKPFKWDKKKLKETIERDFKCKLDMLKDLNKFKR